MGGTDGQGGRVSSRLLGWREEGDWWWQIMKEFVNHCKDFGSYFD